jgi:hypothetical protein
MITQTAQPAINELRRLEEKVVRLFLPGALLVTIQTQLFATFMFINLCLTTFFN